MNFANREVCDLYVLDYNTKKPVLFCDYANTNATELTSESVFAYGGKGHPRRVGFNGEKGGTFQFETQLQSYQLYAVITGGELGTTSKYVGREVVTCETAGTLTIEGTAVAGSVNVFAEDDDCGTALESTVSGTTITCSAAESGKKYIVYYIYEIASGVQSIKIKSTSFPKACIIYADTLEKTEDDQFLPYHMIVHKAQPQANISLSNSNSGDPGTLTVVFDLLADENDDMITLDLLEAEE